MSSRDLDLDDAAWDAACSLLRAGHVHCCAVRAAAAAWPFTRSSTVDVFLIFLVFLVRLRTSKLTTVDARSDLGHCPDGPQWSVVVHAAPEHAPHGSTTSGPLVPTTAPPPPSTHACTRPPPPAPATTTSSSTCPRRRYCDSQVRLRSAATAAVRRGRRQSGHGS